MTLALVTPPPLAADPGVAGLLQMFGQDDAPAVEIKYAPGVCDTDHAQLFDPDIRDVARAICRHLDLGPADWVAVSAGLGQFERARTWIYDLPPDHGGRRLGIVSGLSFAYLNVARTILLNRMWRPGRNREVVAHAQLGELACAADPGRAS